MSGEKPKDSKDAGKEKIDFSKYQTAELAEQLTELFGVPRAVLRVFLTGVGVALLGLLLGYFLLIDVSDSLIAQISTCLYALVIGLFFGVVLGILRLVNSSLENIESILGIVLKSTGAVADYHEKIQSGDEELPGGSELIEQVYEHVVLPVIEKSVSKAFGPLAPVLLAVYRKTIGSAVRQMIQLTNQRETTEEDEKAVEELAAEGMESISKYSETIIKYTTSAAQTVSELGSKLRSYIMTPCYIIYSIALIVAISSLLLFRNIFFA